MRYKQQVSDRLETATQRVDIVLSGLESRTLTLENIKSYLDQLKRALESAQELVDLESE